MTVDVDPGRTGYFHEAVLYGSDDEFLSVVAPFLTAGVDAGEPTVVACTPAGTELVEGAIGPDGLTFLTGGHYSRPATAIRAFLKLFSSLYDGGAPRIRVVGQIPGTRHEDWHPWGSYEATANHVFAELPLWGLCAYDTREAPDAVLEEVLATHPHCHDAGHHVTNPDYLDPVAFLSQRPPPPPDPLQRTDPARILLDPSARQARQALAELDVASVLGLERGQDLVLATSEVVANAHLHGRGPVDVRTWIGDGRVVVAVTDQGPGVPNPFVGLVPPATGTAGGHGLWIANQVCDQVVAGRDADGFHVRLTALAAPEPG